MNKNELLEWLKRELETNGFLKPDLMTESEWDSLPEFAKTAIRHLAIDRAAFANGTKKSKTDCIYSDMTSMVTDALITFDCPEHGRVSADFRMAPHSTSSLPPYPKIRRREGSVMDWIKRRPKGK